MRRVINTQTNMSLYSRIYDFFDKLTRLGVGTGCFPPATTTLEVNDERNTTHD